MRSYSIYSTFLFFINTFYGQQIVQKCPSDIYSWHTRSLEMGCAFGLKYHCILNHNGTLFEVCIARKIYEADRTGCPWIQFYQQETLFGAKNTKCPNNLRGCPPKGHLPYASDHLYLYTKCLVPEEDRVPKRRKNGSIYERENELLRQIDPRSRNNITIPIVLVTVAVVLASVLLVACLMRQIRKREKDGSFWANINRLFIIAVYGLPHLLNGPTALMIPLT